MSTNFTNTITITFGEVAENHKGMQKIGTIASEGFTYDNLMKMQKMFEDKCETTLVNLHENIDEKVENAYLLIIRNGINVLLEDVNKNINDLYTEHSNLEVDTKAFMYGRVVNKHARHNLCFADTAQEPDYVSGKGRIVAFNKVPLTLEIRNKLPKYLEGADNLMGEGNYYYDLKKCGIGFHGDTERKKVIAIRLGASIPLVYRWFKNSKPVGLEQKFILNHGDLYVMSEKASGFDWKKRSQYTLRHAAGAEKFLKIKT